LIPGFIISWITFPGVIVHEFAHQLFCYLYKIPVYEVAYFRFGNPAGYVAHGPAKKPWHGVMAAIGPFFVNSILGAIIGAPAILPIIQFQSADPLDWVLGWLGVSIAMHSFPSTGDAQVIWHVVKDRSVPFHTKLWAYPVIGLIYAGAIGSFFWLDALYGVFMAGLIPFLLVKALA
jgi:hypothetical protein